MSNLLGTPVTIINKNVITCLHDACNITATLLQIERRLVIFLSCFFFNGTRVTTFVILIVLCKLCVVIIIAVIPSTSRFWQCTCRKSTTIIFCMNTDFISVYLAYSSRNITVSRNFIHGLSSFF